MTSSTSTPSSPSAPSSSPPLHSSPALPTVLQSVFSYIFTDHSASPATPPRTPSSAAVPPSPSSPLSPPPSLLLYSGAPSSPHTPLSSSFAFASASTSPPSASSSLPSTPFHSFASPHVTSSPITPILSHSASSSSPSVSLLRSPRHCAILDLDETLLHSFFPDKVTPYQYQYMVMKCRAQEQEEKEGKLAGNCRTLYQVDVGDGTLVVLMLRPHLRPFLHQLFAQYDVGVWSAGGKLYVDAICRVLFPHDSLYRPLFQLCWDDVQVETNGLSSYTKPLTTLISRFAHLSLPTLFLVDNRKENGLHFPSQLVIAPDYLPRPWEWNGEKDRDLYLMEDCLSAIVECVEHMKGNAVIRRDDADEAMEEDEESDLGDGLDEEDEEEEEEVVEEEDDEEDADDELHVEEAENSDGEAMSASDEELQSRGGRRHRQPVDLHRLLHHHSLAHSLVHPQAGDEAMDEEAFDSRAVNGRRPSQKAAA